MIVSQLIVNANSNNDLFEEYFNIQLNNIKINNLYKQSQYLLFSRLSFMVRHRSYIQLLT